MSESADGKAQRAPNETRNRLFSLSLESLSSHFSSLNWKKADNIKIGREKLFEIAQMSLHQMIEQLQTGKLKAVESISFSIIMSRNAHLEYNCLSDALYKEAYQLAQQLDDYYERNGKPIGE